VTALHLIVPGPLDQRTGGYLYDRRIVEGLRAQGREVEVHELAGRFPLVDQAARAAAAAVVEAVGGTPVIDGLALPAFAGHEDRLPPWAALIHHPQAQETGLGERDAAALVAVERRLVPLAARVIVTSHKTAGPAVTAFGSSWWKNMASGRLPFPRSARARSAFRWNEQRESLGGRLQRFSRHLIAWKKYA
jgi:hypothetical protein